MMIVWLLAYFIIAFLSYFLFVDRHKKLYPSLSVEPSKPYFYFWSILWPISVPVFLVDHVVAKMMDIE